MKTTFIALLSAAVIAMASGAAQAQTLNANPGLSATPSINAAALTPAIDPCRVRTCNSKQANQVRPEQRQPTQASGGQQGPKPPQRQQRRP